MNKLTKILTSLVCAFIIALSSVQAAFFDDAKDHKYAEDIRLLCNLGIVNGDDDGNFNPDNSVSRIEFLTIVLRTLYDNQSLYLSAGGEYAFDDVPKSHWAYHEACFMRLMGMTEGVGDNKFDPTATIALRDAVKILVSALSYGEVAETQGGYPNGYLQVASSIGLMDNAEAANGEAMTRAEVAHLVAGVLDIEDNTELKKTILEKRKYAIIDGTVDAVYELQMGKTLTPGQIQIGGKVYNTNVTLLPCPEIELVGRRVIAYYSADKDAIIHIEKKGEQDVLTIKSRDIAGTPTISQYQYIDANSKTKTEQIENGVVIYNGELLGTGQITPSKLKPNSGEVTLMDTDGNNVYDMIYVKSYDTYTVRSNNNGMIYDRLGNQIDLAEINTVYVYDGDTEVTIGDIKADDVISVMKSMSGDRAWVYISRATAEGRIDTTRTKGTATLCGIGDDEYYISYTYKNKQNTSYAVSMKPGDYRKVYLDIYGEIAFAEATEADRELPDYAYLVSAKTSAEVGDQAAVVRLLTADNKFRNFVISVDEKIRFGRLSGDNYTISKEDADTIATQLNSNKKSLVTYELDEEGKLTKICLPGSRKDSENISRDSSKYSMNYRNKVIDSKYYVDQNTVCFGIPFNGAYEEYMSAGQYNDILKTGSQTLTLYDMEPDGRIGALISHSTVTERYTESKGEYEVLLDYVNSPILFVNDVITKLDEDGDEETYAVGYQLGIETTVPIGNSVNGNSESLDVIKPGSAVQYVTNTLDRSRATTSEDKERIIIVRKVFDFTVDNPYKSTYGYSESYVSRISGVSSMSLDGLVVTFDTVNEISDAAIKLNKSSVSIQKNSGIVVMFYNTETEQFEPATLDDVQIGMEVFVRRRYNNAIEIVIMKD
ncbi:MAG: S-layer homology domain-containing protein [Clostridia bacterium]|nr:S-layer homology domain-containing protein [Clostridia bacterium]